jgi:predicted ATPase
MIKRLDIQNFKSIRQQTLELGSLNVLIGQNGAGKSNFISLLRFLERVASQQLSKYVFDCGGINSLLFNGGEQSSVLKIEVNFDFSQRTIGEDKYVQYDLEIASNGYDYRIEKEFVGFLSNGSYKKEEVFPSKLWDQESLLKLGSSDSLPELIKVNLMELRAYHFHDTSANAKIKLPQPIEDIYRFKTEAENLAPFLFFLKKHHFKDYLRIGELVRLVYPQFNDFQLEESPTAKDMIVLRWTEKGTDNVFTAKQISDGTLRFICLATLLSISIQSNTVSQTILLDEPELGLHPFAINILAELIKKASMHRQIIVATQSVTLINHFQPEDLVIVERTANGETTFNRKNASDLKEWLDDFTLGELWENNFLGGRP